MAHRTKEEKIALADKICEQYESDVVTIESCCNAFGISESIFSLWVKEIGEIGERYKASKHKQECFQKQRIRQKAKTSLEKMVEGYEYEEVTTEGREVNGKFQAVKQVKKTIKVQPVSNLIIFALTNSNKENDNEFHHVNKQVHTGGVSKDGEDLPIQVESKLSTDLLEQMLQQLNDTRSTDTK
jgi:hypothetical protein